MPPVVCGIPSFSASARPPSARRAEDQPPGRRDRRVQPDVPRLGRHMFHDLAVMRQPHPQRFPASPASVRS